MATTVGTLHGAAKRQPTHLINQALEDPFFQDYEKEILHKKIEEDVAYPQPLLKNHCIQTLATLKTQCRFELFVFLLLAWATTQRPGCIFTIRTKDIKQNGSKITCLFRSGKGVRARKQAYSISTTVGTNASTLQFFLSTRQGHQHVFPQHQKDKIYNQLRTELRTHDTAYEMRSSRRGSLICLAEAGASIPILMAFSGHGCEKTLLRYLNWGIYHHYFINSVDLSAAVLVVQILFERREV